MTDIEYRCKVPVYDTQVDPPKWTYNGNLAMEFVAATLEHQACVKLSWAGSPYVVVPLDDFVEAVKWMGQARP